MTVNPKSDSLVKESVPAYKDPRRDLCPETRPFVVGYNPNLSEDSLIPPVYRTSVFRFPTAEAGEEYFKQAYHLEGCSGEQIPGLIYSRVNNPNTEMVEDSTVSLEEGANYAAAFPSGMSAITTTVLALLSPGGKILHTKTVYGGTYFFFKYLAARFGFQAVAVDTSDIVQVEVALAASEGGFDMLFIESPANPDTKLTDISLVADMVRIHNPTTLVVVDNTFLGPVFQHPFELGADVVIYSATKFLGGHSDLIAGIALTRSRFLIDCVKDYRTILGATIAADTAWLLFRSLKTCHLRMKQQSLGAEIVAQALSSHPKVERVLFPGLLAEQDGSQYVIYQKQCSGPGSMITFFLREPGRAAAFRFLNSVEICHLAVSLGGIETLVEHPRTMTHSDMSVEDLDACNITEEMIRVSIGLEDPRDLTHDLYRALGQA